MKQWMAAAALAALLIPASAGAVSPAELADGTKYQPVYMSEAGTAYADLSSIKTGDPVEGQLPLIQADVYMEAYAPAPGYDTVASGGLVTNVFAYHTKLLATHRMNDRESPLTYYMDAKLFGIFDKDGRPANVPPQAGEAQGIALTAEAQDVYLHLYRLL